MTSDGSTPLNPDDLDGLIPADAQTRADLDAWEQTGILDARAWALTRRRKIERVVSEKFLVELHRRMFMTTWEWAGAFRRTDTSIGIHWRHVPTALRDGVADARYWIERSTYPGDVLAARYHHRLVAIHPFPNGNGRWGRLATDVLMRALGQAMPTWGAAASHDDALPRAAYVAAMRAADSGDMRPLTKFMWPPRGAAPAMPAS